MTCIVCKTTDCLEMESLVTVTNVTLCVGQHSVAINTGKYPYTKWGQRMDNLVDLTGTIDDVI